MQLFSSIPNWVEPRGFLFGWESASLGNCLSTAANLVAFSIRTGVPVFYPNIDGIEDIFSDPSRSRALFDLERTADIEKFRDLQSNIEKLLKPGTEYYASHTDTILLEQLPAYHEARSVVLMLQYIQRGIHDWRDGHRELLASSFCRNGNGLIYPGAYWLQYKNMQEAGEYGPALRDHIGELRTDGCGERAEFRATTPGLHIGIHVRQGDYRGWHEGRYFFTWEEYESVIQTLHRTLGDRPHTFHICADTDLRSFDFGDLPVFYRRASSVDDFLCLSTCDYVVGAPSTFATWAAFLGAGRRLILTRDRIGSMQNMADPLSLAVGIPFPTGGYLPGDDMAGPI